MKITDSEVIKSGEQELIDAITADLDWGTIENVFREEHGLGIDEEVEYKRGDIVVHKGVVAYQLDFEVKVTLSVLLDRDGNYISTTSSSVPDHGSEQTVEEKAEDEAEIPPDKAPADTETSPESPPPEPGDQDEAPQTVSEEEAAADKISQMASQAGDIMEGL